MSSLLFLLAAGCLVIVAGGFYYLIYRLRQQQRQITLQNEKFEVMLGELHHRVKNNLQIVSALLGLQRYKSEDPDAINVLRESQQRVQAMGMIHHRLYKKNTLRSVNIREYLVDLSDSLLSSYGYNKERFFLEIDVCIETLDIDLALPIGLIVNELMTNAFKYAYIDVREPALWISLAQADGVAVLEVRDNGVGMNVQDWGQGRESLGKQLIGALCRQIRAEQEMSAVDGTSFVFRIPLAA